MRAGFVVMARDQQRHRHAAHLVVDDAVFGSQLDAPAAEMFCQRERDAALESRGRQNFALVSGLGQPLHDRPQALRHARRGIADAVIVDQEKTHALRIDSSPTPQQ